MLTRVPRSGAGTPDHETVAGWVAVEDRDHPPVLLLSADEGRSFVAAQQLVDGESPLGIRVRFRSRSIAEWEVPLDANGPRLDPGPLSAWRFDPGSNVVSRLASAVR